eukprot:scaffold564_cov248-Pinguiococcus_pyrenoidosus.AAC.6
MNASKSSYSGVQRSGGGRSQRNIRHGGPGPSKSRVGASRSAVCSVSQPLLTSSSPLAMRSAPNCRV